MSSSEPVDYKRIFFPVEDAAKLWQKAPDRHFATEQARAIFREVLPTVLERFVRKNADYGNTAAFLGAKGQFADINPKFWKLKRALWEGEELHGESIEEICEDLVGHCLLTIYFLDLERKEKELVDKKPHPAGPTTYRDHDPLPPHNHDEQQGCPTNCPRGQRKDELRREFRERFPGRRIPPVSEMIRVLTLGEEAK